ncbi:BAX inhibitor protein [Bacterioplanes sanyensis]|uniref:BAX inhibitor protein n=1 Tax=Bacterioplanes sanyensis TaxID=1249553 RepID=A0A222FM75_9GAMM|nr:Bax inhibitor-1/YccA family protein [Bacterioplanes sanyensis]ASP40125.1 BAX inhibitor protein [Bacterioplanes sanyensis]
MNRPDYLNMKSDQSADSRVATHDTLEGYRRDQVVSADGRKVLRNTYALLSMTLLFSGAMAMVSMALNVPHFGLWTLLFYFGLLFFVEKTKDSAMGLVAVFALTGFMGLTLGPILSFYLTQVANGGQLIAMAMGTTGLIFLTMSGWVLSTGKDLSGWGKSLMVGILVAFVLSLGAFFFEIPALALAVSAMFIILMTGLIAFQTSAILHGGETNYISATVTLYVAIYNLFLSLLQIFGVMGGDE